MKQSINVNGAPAAQVFLRGCPVAEYGKVHTELKGKYIHRTARQL